MEQKVIHKAGTRGKANHGWLESYHSFSFGSYYNPDRMGFGVLRVLNDDCVAPRMGFETHPHNNMEIISIPLKGDLEHKDSLANVAVIKSGDIQVMSAGTGVAHSEYNKNTDSEVRFLQIWIIPKSRDVKPRYDQITLNETERQNRLQQILSPNVDDEGVWIHQDAWFHLGKFDNGVESEYSFKNNGNGLYIFVLNGDFLVNQQVLSNRDGMGIWNTDIVSMKALNDESEVLLMEVPMSE